MFILNKKIQLFHVCPRLWIDALFQMQLCWGEKLSWFLLVHSDLPLPWEKLLSPGPHQLSPLSASQVRRKSLQVKQCKQERLIQTEMFRGKSQVPGWASISLSADPKEWDLRNGASRQRRLWVCQCAVCTEALAEWTSAYVWTAQTGEGQL